MNITDMTNLVLNPGNLTENATFSMQAQNEFDKSRTGE
jgi:hypothetical protein